ncbi:MAG: hypothetical protein H7X95_09405 [Deltaproteobacteria bacterium]|nr:hypothetical protein [Deltaproteobacteria bacterium]
MGLELVGGRSHGQGHGGESHDGDGEGGRTLIERLTEAERLIAASRQRLQGLAENVADLRRRLAAAASADPSGDAGNPDI